VIARARTVNAMLDRIGLIESLPKAELQCGDCVLVSTENSVYSIRVLEGGTYSISGGWFDRQGLSPATTGIAGCTWGGSAIKRDIVAALGLRLEFGNRVVTSRIREVQVIRGGVSVTAGFAKQTAASFFLPVMALEEAPRNPWITDQSAKTGRRDGCLRRGSRAARRATALDGVRGPATARRRRVSEYLSGDLAVFFPFSAPAWRRTDARGLAASGSLGRASGA
jgi:hypothetical protein